MEFDSRSANQNPLNSFNGISKKLFHRSIFICTFDKFLPVFKSKKKRLKNGVEIVYFQYLLQ